MKKNIEKFTKLLESFLNHHSYYVLPNENSIISLKFYNETLSKSNLKIKFTPLISENKIEIVKKSTGLHVLIDSYYANFLLRRKISAKNFTIFLALYFFHELVHVQDQKIGKKELVTHLRGEEDAYGQMMLLIYDFEADRKAITGTIKFLTHSGFKFDEVDLLKIQSESLCDFPSGIFHSKNAVKRKNVRLVANRLYYLARREKFFEEQLEGSENYFMVRWGCSSESNQEFTFCLSLCGTSSELLGIAKIDKNQFNILEGASLEATKPLLKMKNLDRALIEILHNLHLGR